MANDIRSYGPGKFSTIVDSYVYQVTLGGNCDDECGDSSCGSWYGLMRGGSSIFLDHDPFQEPLNDAERDLLNGCAGVIVREDNDGFVCVDYIDTDDELDRKWDAILAEQQLRR